MHELRKYEWVQLSFGCSYDRYIYLSYEPLDLHLISKNQNQDPDGGSFILAMWAGIYTSPHCKDEVEQHSGS